MPTLYSVLTTGANATDASIYGTDTNAYVLDKDEIVDIILNNDDSGKHPFHLHGHNFQVISRSADSAGHFNASNTTMTKFPTVPMRRDTLMVYPEGNFVIRFKADNPGYVAHRPMHHILANSHRKCLALPLSHRVAHVYRTRCHHD